MTSIESHTIFLVTLISLTYIFFFVFAIDTVL